MNIILFPSLLETTAVNRLRDEFQCEFSRPWEAGLREWGYGHRTGGRGLGAPGLLHAQRKLRGPRDTAGEARARGSSPSRWLSHATPAGWREPWAPGPRAGRPRAQRGACPRRPPPAGRAMDERWTSNGRTPISRALLCGQDASEARESWGGGGGRQEEEPEDSRRLPRLALRCS